VTEESDALTLERGVFTSKDPKRIAASLKRSAERSRRRKADPFRSALSMLTFYINLYQPRGPQPAGCAQEDPDAREGRATPPVREGIERESRDCGAPSGARALRRTACPSFSWPGNRLVLSPQGRAANAGRDDNP
jgi:hypothetical protein